MLKLNSLLLALLLLLPLTLATPIAPTTLDGATPIDAQVSAADFGALDAFAEDAEAESSATAASEAGFKIALLPMPAKTAESVNLEQEALPSKVLTAYDKTHQKLADITHPVPILDGISEHEKYGNNGDKFDGISRSIVNGYEAFSNLLNSFIQSRKLSTKLTQVGLVKVPPRILATQFAELDLNGPANTRQIADYLLENRLTVNNGSLQLAAPKEQPHGECHCADRLGLLARLITSRHDPIYTARISPSLKYLSDIMQELLSILSLLFVVGLLLACYLCSKPRELSFLQRLLRKLSRLFATDSCYDCGLC